MEYIKNPNIRNTKNAYPYQLCKSSAIRDLFYRTYIAPRSALYSKQGKIGIEYLSHKMSARCQKYEEIMLQKLDDAQKECSEVIETIMNNCENSVSMLLKCVNYERCKNIAKYACAGCGRLLYCDVCINPNQICQCGKSSFFKTQAIHLDYKYDKPIFTQAPVESQGQADSNVNSNVNS